MQKPKYGNDRNKELMDFLCEENKREKLKPCPFCGGKAQVYQDYTSHYLVQCTKCGITTLHYGDTQSPKDVWNRRTKNERKTD